MCLRLTRYGLPQVVVYPAITAALMAVLVFAVFAGLSAWIFWPIEIILFAVFLWILSFFRDPKRVIPSETNLIIAPADGTVMDIETSENDYIDGQCIRIGIFLSIFNVHLNRMPCNCIVDKVIYNKGLFKNAMNLESSRVNESNDLYLHRIDEPKDAIIVRQISGAIARRIVCQAQAGQKFEGGQLFGMIKFGSRTEIYIPARGELKVIVNIGDKVKAGQTIAAKYEV
jgi:phosphatidylserine decarboxylase